MMDLVKKRKTHGPSSPEFNPEPTKKSGPNDRVLKDRAVEMGIPVDVTREWALIVERADLIASTADETLVPSRRFRELERQIVELKRQVELQSITIRILEKKGLL